MSTVIDLLADIAAFCRRNNMAETTFGRHAVNDGKFVGRLRAGADVTLGTVDRVKAYMASAGNKDASLTTSATDSESTVTS